MAEPSQKPQDPSMEDILASIRQILNEDEEKGPQARPLELTEDMLVRPEVVPTAAPPPPQPEATGAAPGQPPAPAATASPAVIEALEELARAVVRNRHAPVQRAGGPSIEDLVREELRPMLKAWLDTHLPPLVERLVKAEIARLTNRGEG